MENLILRDPIISDLNLILKWRNDIEVRRVSENQNEIPLPAHEKWFHHRISETRSQPFWMVEHETQTIGLVRFDLSTSLQFEISILFAPEVRRKGFGKRALDMVLVEFRRNFPEDILIAKIHKLNYQSIKLFNSCNFVEIYTEGEFMVLKHKTSND